MWEIINRNWKMAQVKRGDTVLTSTKDSSSCRRVFVFDDFVVKFEPLGNSYQNKRELYFYQELLEPEDEEFFPKLLAHGVFDGDSFIIQERVDHTEIPTKEHEELLKYLTKKYLLDDLVFYLPNKDFFPKGYVANLAITKDGLKIYDIGIHDSVDFSYSSDSYIPF